MRHDLARAFGIEELVAVDMVRSNGRPTSQAKWQTVRAMTPHERELLEPTEHTRPVDFHSFRRAYKQALAEAGVEIQAAMGLSGASDARAHSRYLANTGKLRTLPEGAVPTLAMADAENPKPKTENGMFSGAGEEIRTLDVNLGKVALYH